MAKKELFYQVGLCRHCSDKTRQLFLDGINECSEEIPHDDARRYVYGDVHTLSFFRCDGCKGILIYRTYYADAVDIAEADKLDPKWIFRLNNFESESSFTDCSSLLYSTNKDTGERIEAGLDPPTPEPVRNIYNEALAVKDRSPNAFAMLVGKALEAMQKDLDIPRRQLEELESRSSPHGLTQLAVRIKDWRNAAAHYDAPTDNVSAEQAADINTFFRLITEYVYVLPDKLEKARAKVELDVDAAVDGIH
jgi:hypothetical protein